MIWMRNKSSVLIALVISWPASYTVAVIRQPYNPACVGLSHRGSRKMETKSILAVQSALLGQSDRTCGSRRTCRSSPN